MLSIPKRVVKKGVPWLFDLSVQSTHDNTNFYCYHRLLTTFYYHAWHYYCYSRKQMRRRRESHFYGWNVVMVKFSGLARGGKIVKGAKRRGTRPNMVCPPPLPRSMSIPLMWKFSCLPCFNIAQGGNLKCLKNLACWRVGNENETGDKILSVPSTERAAFLDDTKLNH